MSNMRHNYKLSKWFRTDKIWLKKDILNRLKELENIETKIEQRGYESKIRAWNIVTGIIIGLVIAGLAKLLFG